MLWEQVEPLLVRDPNGHLLFDDTVLDKRFSHSIELGRRQSSGNEHRVIRDIGLISCVYVNIRHHGISSPQSPVAHPVGKRFAPVWESGRRVEILERSRPRPMKGNHNRYHLIQAHPGATPLFSGPRGQLGLL